MKKFYLNLFVSFMLVFAGNLYAQEVRIDLSQEHQLIRGFGGMNFPRWIGDLNPDQVDKVFGNEPGQLGLSILRVGISPNSSQFSLELPTAVAAKNHGATIIATPWSPPANLKSNNHTTGGYLLPENYGAYADHLLSFASYMDDNEVPLHAISIQNEPDIEVSYESCDWSSLQFINFLKEQGSRFESVNLIVAESFNFNHNITDPILNNSEAQEHVDIIGGHLYGHRWAPKGGLVDYTLARNLGKEVWMTEHLTGSGSPEQNDWNLAMDLAQEITDCMQANFNAYIWWYIRRFYSFINDEGNITDKGYVISHFSKFVRPGAVRVNANDASLHNVSITAYKTDSTFTTIVVNRNNSSVEIDFNIEDAFFDGITQYTTSAAKKVVNDGYITLNNGAFSATVDANSITTFTNYTNNAPKFENQKPIAQAGGSIILEDELGMGSVTTSLDATESFDPDGEIVNYSWSLNGQQIAWEAIHNVSLEIGYYEFVLTITDNDGASDTDTLFIAVESPNNTEIWIEAECGNVGANWQILPHDNASNGWYVQTTPGIQSLSNPSTNPDDLISYTFITEESGMYKFWARMITPTPNDDSFWIKIGNHDWVMWNNIPSRSSWHWDDLHEHSSLDNVVFFELEAGEHELLICMREDGAQMDKILIANTGIAPVQMGGDAVPCTIEIEDEEPDDDSSGDETGDDESDDETDDDETNNDDEIDDENTGDDESDDDETVNSTKVFTNTAEAVKIYPNPASRMVNINWKNGFDRIQIINHSGQSVFTENINKYVEEQQINFDLKPGLYFIILRGNNHTGVGKILIN